MWNYIKLGGSYQVGDWVKFRSNIRDCDLYGHIVEPSIRVRDPSEGGQLHTVELTPISSRKYGYDSVVVQESLIRERYPNQDYWDEMAWEG